MSFTNHTENYELPQWVDNDKPTFRIDMNTAFANIDRALKALSDAISGIGADNFGQQITNINAKLTELQTALNEAKVSIANVETNSGTNTTHIQELTDLTGLGKTLDTTAKTLVDAINELKLYYTSIRADVSKVQTTVAGIPNTTVKNAKQLLASEVNNGVVMSRTSVKDANSNLFWVLDSGIYKVNPTAEGNPCNSYGILVVLRADDVGKSRDSNSWIMQLFFPTNSAYIYRRNNINYSETNWSDWMCYHHNTIVKL